MPTQEMMDWLLREWKILNDIEIEEEENV